MRIERENAAVVGVGAVACAACCAGPILGFLAAIGLGTAAGVAMFGSIALLAAAIAVIVGLFLRRRRADACESAASPVAVEMPSIRAHG